MTKPVYFQCAQYIGEIARYLYATPESPFEKQHTIRMMFGNGLRPQIWQQFVDRFKIKQVCEFYGSTEGNCSVGNFSNKYETTNDIKKSFCQILLQGWSSWIYIRSVSFSTSTWNSKSRRRHWRTIARARWTCYSLSIWRTWRTSG